MEGFDDLTSQKAMSMQNCQQTVTDSIPVQRGSNAVQLPARKHPSLLSMCAASSGCKVRTGLPFNAIFGSIYYDFRE
jgi:hypothetical protein